MAIPDLLFHPFPLSCSSMTALQSPDPSIAYPSKTIQRAERAARCAPFQPLLYKEMQHQGVALKAIASRAGVQNHYTQRPLPELVVENNLLWLIQVGLLRREVDGQGLTDSFRITPLGRQLLQRWNGTGFPPPPPLLMRLQNLVSRWMQLPGLS